MPHDVPPLRLVVRCLAQKQDAQWQAFSLEFGLAAQADSFAEVKRKLDAMIQDYLYDALVGEDREHACALLSRRAPWWVFARYYYARIISSARDSMNGDGLRTFGEPWGLEPKRLAI